MRTIKVCSGIGDNIWLLMKLNNQLERFNFLLPNGFPQRGKQIFDIFPKIANSAAYSPNVITEVVLADPNDRCTWEELRQRGDFNLSCNHHLDTGNRIEKFLPDLKTSFILDYNTSGYINVADDMLSEQPTSEFIGLYTSSYRTSKAWNGWKANHWVDLAEKINRAFPKRFTFVVIGADWDIDLETKLCTQLSLKHIPFMKVIGKSLGLVSEIMKRLHYFIGFPSGLSILNETLGARGTVMFYPKHLEPMQNAWADPERIESGAYKGCQFCEPETIFRWLNENKKL